MTIKKLFTVGLILTAAISLNAAYRSYGNDYLNLLRGPGGELYGSAYGLMASGSENVMLDPANLSGGSGKDLYLYYSSWFSDQVSAASLAYRFSHSDRNMGIMISRVGVDDIPDSRQALLDYGLDGIPGTGDEGEGNGQLDENEIIDYDGVTFTSTSNLVAHFAAELGSWKSFDLGASVGFMYANLSETSGMGLTFNLYAQHEGKNVKSLYSLENIPSALMVYEQGVAEYYAPSANASWILPLQLGGFSLTPGVNASLSILEDQQTALVSIADAVSLQLRPLLRVMYGDHLAAGLSWQNGSGFYGGVEILLKDVDICYSFRPVTSSDLGSSHLVSLRLSPSLLK